MADFQPGTSHLLITKQRLSAPTNNDTKLKQRFDVVNELSLAKNLPVLVRAVKIKNNELVEKVVNAPAASPFYTGLHGQAKFAQLKREMN